MAVDKYENDPVLKEDVDQRLQNANMEEYDNGVESEHFIWVLIRDVGIENIKKTCKKTTQGYKGWHILWMPYS